MQTLNGFKSFVCLFDIKRSFVNKRLKLTNIKDIKNENIILKYNNVSSSELTLNSSNSLGFNHF